MLFYRNILTELRKWADKKDRKPLVLRGARQVGKTTAINMFSHSFDNYIYLNLEKQEHRQIFESDHSISDLIQLIFLTEGKQRNAGKTLIFIDEIQNSVKAISLLRFFYEEAKDIYVITAGSLLENILDRNISFPVGRVEYLIMYPCTFSEFLLATGETMAHDLIVNDEVPLFAHDKLNSLFKKYATIGGMPEVVKRYAETRDLTALSQIANDLILSYSEDVEKYSHSDSKHKYLRHIISNVFREAATRITFENFGKSNYRSREIKEAFDILEKTMLLRLVYPVTSVKLPLIPNIRKKPKLQLLDTGLVNVSLGIQNVLVANKYLDDTFRGRIAEHIIGQELQALSIHRYHFQHFWVRDKKGSDAEVDFVINHHEMVIPIEVKSGASGSLRSLHQFVDMSPHHYAVRFWSGKFLVEDTTTISGKKYRLINVPLYMAGNIKSIMDRFFI